MDDTQEIIRIPYILLNPPGTPTEYMSDKITEKIDMKNFLIKKSDIYSVKPGNWFIFVDKEKKLCVTETNDFIWLCKRNNEDGSFEVSTTVFDMVETNRIMTRIRKLLKREEN